MARPSGLPEQLPPVDCYEPLCLALEIAKGIHEAIQDGDFDHESHKSRALGHAIAVAEETLSDARVMVVPHNKLSIVYDFLTSSIMLACLEDTFRPASTG